MAKVTTIDPATGELLAEYPETTPEGIGRTLDAAKEAATASAGRTPEQRAVDLRALAQALRERKEVLALLATREMGKPITESRAEVDKCAWACEWFADHAPSLLQPERVELGPARAQVSYQPLGVIYAVMPWNFPYWQVVRALAPAVAAGNALVVKHAAATTGCAVALAEAAATAGLGNGLLSVIVTASESAAEVSEQIIVDDRVAAVTLTGSTAAGRSVAAVAGRALKKTVLELGGSDPFVVLADADLDAAADWAVRSRFQNGGQSCIAAKRIVVEAPVAEALTERLVSRVGGLEVGDPTLPGTAVGPLARGDLRETLDRQVQASVKQGARVLAGGQPIAGPGFFYQPTVLDTVTDDMAVCAEEVFGPVLPVLSVPDAEAAIAAANRTRFGLGSNLWTSDLARGEALAGRLAAGHTAVNGMTQSDPRLPFGGVKDSGYGRELSSHGLHEFVNVHAIVVNGPHGPGATVAAE